MATSESLKITGTPIIDKGIERFQVHEYKPIVGTNLNTTSDVEINIEQHGIFTQPSAAYLISEGRLTKTDCIC